RPDHGLLDHVLGPLAVAAGQPEDEREERPVVLAVQLGEDLFVAGGPAGLGSRSRRAGAAEQAPQPAGLPTGRSGNCHGPGVSVVGEGSGEGENVTWQYGTAPAFGSTGLRLF